MTTKFIFLKKKKKLMTTKIYSRPYIWMDVSSPSSKFQSVQYFFFTLFIIVQFS